MNEDGSLVVLGRKSVYSVIGEKKIYNFDVERAILTSDRVKLCEIQTHPMDENKLVAHIVWENDAKVLIKQRPEKQIEFLTEIQKTVSKSRDIPEAVPYCFCVRDSFPSAHSGKRDVQFIKNDIEEIIIIQRTWGESTVQAWDNTVKHIKAKVVCDVVTWEEAFASIIKLQKNEKDKIHGEEG